MFKCNSKKNINELEILLSYALKNSNIPKPETEANLKLKIEEIKKKLEKNLQQRNEVKLIMMIIKQKCGIINKWKADINNLIEFEREVLKVI